MGVRIAGVGKAVPNQVLTNNELCEMVDTSDDWIKSRTGIERRHIAVSETTQELATKAALEALQTSGSSADEIDLIIVATVSPDSMMPSTACMVARNIKAYHANCFDVTAACSGFIVASEVAINMIRQGSYRKALVIGAEVLSKMLDWEDRTTCVIFGDGAGAVIYEVSAENHILAIQTGSDPRGAEKIKLPVTAGNHAFYQVKEEKSAISMEGRAVYAFAITKVPQGIYDLLKEVGLEVEDIDHFILHQANSRIIDHVAKKLGIPEGKLFKNLSEYGNTSAASIPMALYDAKDELKSGEKIILSGFGAGLTWGTMLVQW